MERMKDAYAAQEAERAKEQEAVADTERELRAAELKEQIRNTFMALPGASEEQFEQMYPDLLADHYRAEMAARR